jgi:hypothetical protein
LPGGVVEAAEALAAAVGRELMEKDAVDWIDLTLGPASPTTPALGEILTSAAPDRRNCAPVA